MVQLNDESRGNKTCVRKTNAWSNEVIGGIPSFVFRRNQEKDKEESRGKNVFLKKVDLDSPFLRFVREIADCKVVSDVRSER